MHIRNPGSVERAGYSNPSVALPVTVAVNAQPSAPCNPLIVWGRNRGPTLAAAFNEENSVHEPWPQACSICRKA